MFDAYWPGATVLIESLGASTALFAGLSLGLAGLLVRALRASRQQSRQLARYRSALDEHCMVNIKDPEGRITWVNARFEKVSGLDRSAVIGRRISELYPDAISPQKASCISAAMDEGRTWSGDSEWRRQDGTSYYTHQTLVPQFDRKGRLREIVSLGTDTTNLRNSDAEMQLRNVLDLWLDEVWMFSPGDLSFSYLNLRAQARLGWEGQNYLGRSVAETGGLIDVAQLQREAHRLLQGRAKSVSMQLHDGDRSVDFTLQLVKPLGSAPRFVAVLRDVTEQEEANRAKSEFIAMVSHELRTPLTSIKGGLGLLSMTAGPQLSERSNSILAIAQRNTDRLILLINDILDLEKIDAGKMDFRMTPTDLSALIREAVETNGSYASQFGVTFEGVGLEKPVIAEVSPERLMQVLANLMSNAAKFSPSGASVEVGLRQLGGRLRIFVKDSGPGIPLEAQPRILERFIQAESGDKRRVGGTGLGLSIVKAIVEQHGSEIKFVSAPGAGTEFYFDLPAHEARAIA